MANMNDKVGNLEEEAFKRRDRLKNLKRKQLIDERTSPEKNIQVAPLPRPKFRSYKPQDDSLKENVLPDVIPGNVEAEVKDQLNSANSKVVIEELDIVSLAPRKPDWDLKRDVAKKLERLEKRTQKAIAELIRERLKLRQGQDDLASIVNMAPVQSAKYVKNEQ